MVPLLIYVAAVKVEWRIEGLMVATKTSRACGHGFMLGAIGQLAP